MLGSTGRNKKTYRSSLRLWSPVIRETAVTPVSDLFFEKLHCLAIVPDEFSDRQRMGIVLPHRAGYRNLVPGIQAVLGPSRSGQFVGSGEFTLPVFDFAFIVLNVEKNERMRIESVRPTASRVLFKFVSLLEIVFRT
jgi:hypothetical protein